VIAVQQRTAERGDIVVAGIPGDEATVKTYQPRGTNIVLVPANPTMEPMEFPADEVSIFGRVVTVIRRL
jgi:repressor LexA